jgi:hypothetical protein
MADVKNNPFRVQMKIVADIKKTGEGAQVVKGRGEDVRPRVDITTNIETGGFDKQAGNTSLRDGLKASGNAGAAVPVGKGGGVLGHLLATKPDALPDADQLSNADLKRLLEPHKGKPLVVTTWDREEADNLTDASKKQSVGDTRGVLVGVDAEGIRLQRNGRVETVRTEFWALARVRLDDDKGGVLAQDPSYPKLFSD